MRRFFLIILVLLLPLQSAWAAATAYCQHEQRPAAKWHLGHHQHEHRSDGNAEAGTYGKVVGGADNRAYLGADNAADRNADRNADHNADHNATTRADANHGTDAKGLFDPDCGTCHLASLPFACPEPTVLPALRLPRTVLVTHDLHYTSLHSRAPDRPQWRRLA